MFIGPPPGGKGNLRKFLKQMDDEQKAMEKEMLENPLYKEGYDDGYAAAQKAHKKLYTALSAVYQIGDD